MNRSLQLALGRLRASEGGQLPGSQLGAGQRRALERFARQTGSIRIEPRGRGVVYRVVLPAVVERHWRELTPIEADQLDSRLPDRAGNIARARSSKSAAHRHDVHYLLLKARHGDVVWRDACGHSLDLTRATREQGVAALAVSGEAHGDGGWAAPGDLWLVENQALFTRLDWLPPAAAGGAPGASVAYYSGQLPNALIDWLALSSRAATLWFFPDYDGVGLLNYVRLRERVGATARLWLMPHWRARLQRFGSAALWRQTAREFDAALTRLQPLAQDEELHALVEAMQIEGMALEQEAVWLAPG